MTDQQPEPSRSEQSGPDHPAVGEASILASDAEREAVVSRLNAACGEGRLTLEEFSDRLERSYTARTRGELEPLLRDLPLGAEQAAEPAVHPSAGRGRTDWHVTPLGGLRRSGRWRMRDQLVSVTLIGGVDLDLREAQLDAPEVTLTSVSVIGGVSLTVPPGVSVVTEGFSLLGGRRIDVDEVAGDDAPTLRVRSFSVLGGLRVSSSRPYDGFRAARESRREALADARSQRGAALADARSQRRSALADARAGRRDARQARRDARRDRRRGR
ncbi:protein of unknown function [Actinopolymorpha cephalotaxi]|uniref:DUF1707 domain-containing protein n=1 Tax=Actinopolymorpha cephalotaxi TaxID=504797 RepID=A0A1I2ZIB5_9ACTN|nr:DUF1707 domain-containing protein [Actinopolymorpha cephalotaxi]NYH82013.1 hypothetical protein [Actinopolymorpha cephalotaxi]SFH37602.1 protein of unknown function [Actinopolymorpha cephalotaxi]